MRRTSWVRWAVVGLVGIVAVAFGSRPTLKGGQPTGLIASQVVGGAFGGSGAAEPEPAKVIHVAAPPMSPQATKVWLKLQEKLTMNFPNDTPLEDVKKYIEESTKDDKAGFPTGIPIYIDPQGLQNSDKTMASTVSISLEGMPLALTLKLLLKQVNLAYYIQKDGLLVITTQDDDEVKDGSAHILEELGSLRTEVQALRREIQELHRPGPAEASAKAATSK